VDKECQTWTITHTTDYATRARTGNERQTVAVIIPSAKLNKWKTLVQKAFGVSSGGSFKPSRQCTIRLDKPLIITPVVARRREDLINGRFSMTTAQFLSAAVAEANLAASEDKNVWELKFQDGDTDPENYIQVSQVIELTHREKLFADESPDLRRSFQLLQKLDPSKRLGQVHEKPRQATSVRHPPFHLIG
jgi:hypothetical protein